MKIHFNKGILLFFLSSIFYFSSCVKVSNYVKIADTITEKTAKKLQEQKKLLLVGTGGQMMGDIQVMDMALVFYEELDFKDARKLIIYAVNEYLLEINDSKEIRHYLHNYPFTTKNVEIVIYFYNPDGSKIPSGKIEIAAAKRGKIVYFTDYPEQHTIKTICEETYEEALEIINSNKQPE